MSIILMRPATSATEHINADPQLHDLAIPVQSVGQVIAAGILGNRDIKLEEAIRSNVPFVLDPKNGDNGTELMPWSHQLHDVQMIERTNDIVRRITARHEGLNPMSEIEMDFKAQRIVSHVKEHIVKHGLHIYSQKWLFDSARQLSDRLSLLKTMANLHYGPQSATTAIASGLMPPLPAYSVPDFVRMLDSSWKGVGFQVENRDPRGWIASRQPYLVEFPLPNVAAGKTSRTDRIDRWGQGESIFLGLGFMLVDLDEQFDQFRVVTPMLTATRTKLESPRYTKQYILKSYSRVYRKEYKQLADLLHHSGRTKVARLEVCPKCNAIFSKHHQGLAHANCTN
jgi:hypothetical protein